jgi:predicted PurR-regulated permease PerM
VKISPLTVLLAIVVGTEIAGILGALAAIPVAGSIRVIALELLRPGTARDDAGAPNREGTPVPRTAGYPTDVTS